MSTVTESPAIADRIRAAFPFTVDRYPLSGPDGLRTSWYGLFRSDSGAAVGPGSVTARYEPHTLEDVTALADAASAAFGGAADVRCHFADGHYVVVQPSREERLAVFGTDTVWPRFVVSAPYGGGGSFRASLGLYRDACRNLAILRRVSGTTATIRHTRGLRDRMEDLVQMFGTLRARWGGVADTIRAMEATRVDLPAFLDSVYGEPGNTPRARALHRRRTAAIVSRVIRERAATGRPALAMEGGSAWVSAWEAYNGVQGFTQHDQRRHGSPSPLERALDALASADVARAEELALSA